jgi:hypothetical protein
MIALTVYPRTEKEKTPAEWPGFFRMTSEPVISK